ncbi:MAG: hypothetical protein AAGI46_06020 [Planctomycetota bacterium]
MTSPSNRPTSHKLRLAVRSQKSKTLNHPTGGARGDAGVSNRSATRQASTGANAHSGDVPSIATNTTGIGTPADLPSVATK